jgi:hypothetical protein
MKNPAVAALLACLPLAVACSAQAEPAPSIVLIVIDTLRVDAVSSYGEVAGTTPELDALASSGLRYERAYAPAPWTLPSARDDPVRARGRAAPRGHVEPQRAARAGRDAGRAPVGRRLRHLRRSPRTRS